MKKKRAAPLRHSEQPAAIRARWRRWLVRIEVDLRELVVSRHIYDVVGRIVDGNRKAGNPSDYHRWCIRNHAFTTAMGIRRMMDGSPDVISLMRLLRDLEARAHAMTRASHESRWRKPMRAVGGRSFSRLVGEGAQSLPPDVPRRERKRLQASSQRAEALANKVVAHLDERNLKRAYPSIRAMHQVVDQFEMVFRKYNLLLNAQDYGLLPTWQYDWTTVFHHTWKPDERWMANG